MNIKRYLTLCLIVILFFHFNGYAAQNIQTAESCDSTGYLPVNRTSDSHIAQIKEMVLAVDTPSMLLWLQERQQMSGFVAREQRMLLRNALHRPGYLFKREYKTDKIVGVDYISGHLTNRDELAPIKRYKIGSLYEEALRCNCSLPKVIEERIQCEKRRARSRRRYYENARAVLARKPRVAEEFPEPNCVYDIMDYINDRDALPANHAELLANLLEKRYSPDEKQDTRRLVFYQEMLNEIKQIDDLLDFFGRQDLRENTKWSAWLLCLPCIAVSYLCNPE